MMMYLIVSHVALLLRFGMADAVGSKTEKPKVIKAILGNPLTLDCTYNCSSGFVHGHWRWENVPACGTCLWLTMHENKSQGHMCTVFLHTLNLTLEQTLYNYTCVSVMTDHPDLPHNIEQLVSLQIQVDKTTSVTHPQVPSDASLKVEISQNLKWQPENYTIEGSLLHSIKVSAGTQLSLKCLSTATHCEGQWTRDNGNFTKGNTGALVEWDEITEEDGGRYRCHTNQLCTSQAITVEIEVNKDDELGWRALAGVALSAAAMLILLLIYLCYKRRSNVVEPDDSDTAIYANTRTKNEIATHKPTAQDCQSDHEVPYADIVISVRGSSIPELTGLQSKAPRDHRLRWREEAAGGSHLHACRSADRLHVHPREVSRKLSTTSEYAVITYSAETLS